MQYYFGSFLRFSMTCAIIAGSFSLLSAQTQAALKAKATVETGRSLEAEEGQPVPSLLLPNIAAIKQRGKLVVALVNVDSPPYFMKDEKGNLTGIDIKLARMLAKELGVDVVFDRQAESYDEVIERIAARKADIGLSNLSLTLPRAAKVLYSKPYITSHKAFLFNRLYVQKLKYQGKRSITDIINDPRTTVGVLTKSSLVVFIRELFPQARIVEFPSWEEIVRKVLDGELSAAFYDEFQVRKVIYYEKGSSLQLLAVLVKDEYDPIHAIAPWENQQFLTWVNEYFTVRKIHFTAEEILKDYNAYLQRADSK